jgi:hypothetical protein
MKSKPQDRTLLLLRKNALQSGRESVLFDLHYELGLTPRQPAFRGKVVCQKANVALTGQPSRL